MHYAELILWAVLPFLFGITNGIPLQSSYNKEIPVEKYFEGDILLRDGFDIKSGIIGDQYRWPGGIIPYEFDEEFDSWGALTVMGLLMDINSKTCVTFKLRDNETEPDYVYFKLEYLAGCYSSVGKQGGRQVINVDYNCSNHGVIQHQAIHTLGFFHEQSRTDRDEYVDIIWENIIPGKETNFEKYSSDQVDHFGVPYDYESLMHFDKYAFSLNASLPTIVPKDADANIGNKLELSKGDIMKIRRMYSIPDDMIC